MIRIVGAILVLGLLSGCASFLQMDDDIALSGQGVLASYDQSTGDLTDAKRVGISASKRQVRPVELATNRWTDNKSLPELLYLTTGRKDRIDPRSTTIFRQGDR